VIVKVNGTDVTPDNTLSFIVAGLPVGTRVPVEYIRNGKHATTTAVVSQRPPEDQLASANDDDDDDGPMGSGQETPSVKNALGVTLQTMSPGIARQLSLPENTTGVVITTVDPSSDAATKGLQSKDIIVAVGQRKVSTVAEAAAAVDAAQKSGASGRNWS
jgi:serine protease Do